MIVIKLSAKFIKSTFYIYGLMLHIAHYGITNRIKNRFEAVRHV
ncbi:hypothetical protein [Lutibacter sp.]